MRQVGEYQKEHFPSGGCVELLRLELGLLGVIRKFWKRVWKGAWSLEKTVNRSSVVIYNLL